MATRPFRNGLFSDDPDVAVAVRHEVFGTK
jgi:hypothetical protein